MKTLVGILVLCASGASNALDYSLEFDQDCTYSIEKRAFPCENSDQPITDLKEMRGKWFGKNPHGKNVVELSLVSEDEYMVILQNPVYFSGISLIHLMKKTGRFYWTETAYSTILKEDEATVRVGRFRLSTDQSR